MAHAQAFYAFAHLSRRAPAGKESPTMTNRIKPALSLALALLFALPLAACALPSPVPAEDGSPNVASDFVPNSAASEPSSGTYLVDVADMAGNQIRLSAYPERIVVLDPGDCEILYAIGAGANVVGRSIYCDYPAEVNLLPYATANGKNDPDVLLLREPQLVVMGPEDAADFKLVDALKNAGAAVVVTNVTDVNSLYGAITLLGALTNRNTEANALVSSLVTSIAAMQAKASAQSDTVYLELTPMAKGMTTYGSGNIFSSIVSLLGYHNEFEDQTGLLSVTQDQVVGRSPDIILTATREIAQSTPDPNATPDPAAAPDAGTAAMSGTAEILSRSEWASVDAVKSGRVYYIDPALITRAGPRIIDGIQALYTALYDRTQPVFK